MRFIENTQKFKIMKLLRISSLQLISRNHQDNIGFDP